MLFNLIFYILFFIFCMCLTIPYQIASKKGDKFVIINKNQKKEALSPLAKVKKGDWVLTQNNIIIRKINQREARELISLFN